MSDTTTPSLIEEIERKRGRRSPVLRYLSENAPEYLVKIDAISSAAFLYDGEQGDTALPIKYRELIVAALLTLRGVSDQGVANHLRRGLAHGLTEREAMEGFQAALIPAGMPALLQGIRGLMIALEDPTPSDATGNR